MGRASSRQPTRNAPGVVGIEELEQVEDGAHLEVLDLVHEGERQGVGQVGPVSRAATPTAPNAWRWVALAWVGPASRGVSVVRARPMAGT